MSRVDVWKTRGFEAFREGTFGNAGQNLYVSRAGVLQRIHQYDLNGDGYIDIVFPNDHSVGEVPPAYVYRDPMGNAELIKLPAEGSQTGTVADLNGDGYDDLIIGMWHNGARSDLNAYIYYGGPDGWSERRIQYIPVPTCVAVAAGDFNGDGKSDLAFLCRPDRDWQGTGQLRLFLQTELGFEPKRFSDFPEIEGDQLAADDLDGDGFADLIVHTIEGEVRVYWGGPDGIDLSLCSAVPVELDVSELESGSQSEKSEKEQSVKPADEWVGEPKPLVRVVRLGRVPHIFVARAESVFLVPVNNDRGFGEPIVLNCSEAIAVAVGDINGNGHEDLVVGCLEPSGDGERSWIYWGGPDGFDEARRTALESNRVCDVAVSDLDGDGYDDIVLCQGHTPELYTVRSLIYRGSPDGVHDTPTQLIAHNPQRALIARPTGDGVPHLVFVNFRSGNVRGDIKSSIYFGGPEGFSKERRQDLLAWRPIDALTCDLNDNGYADLMFVSSYGYGGADRSEEPGSWVYLNGPDGFQDEPAWRIFVDSAHGVCCADLNRDGYLDLIFCSIDIPDLVIIYGTAEGFDVDNPQRLRMERDGIVYNDPRYLCLADLNNDGWLDLVVPQVNHDRSLVLWGGPDGFSMERCQMLSVWHPCCARAADLNGNGYLDLIMGGHEPSRGGEPHDSFAYIYWNGPEGLREDHRTLLPGNTINSMAVADFNNDGMLDLFLTSYHDGRVRDIDCYIYWNRPGRGFSATDRQRIFAHSSSGCMVADFNEDGWVDLVIANHKTWGKHVGDSWVMWNGPEGFDERRITKLPAAGPHGLTSVGPGNIMDRGPDEYYISKAFNLPNGLGITKIGWEATLAAKTWVKAQLRSAETEDGLDAAVWRGPEDEGSWFDSGQSVDPARFTGQWVQYRLTLGAVNSGCTPRVTQVDIHYGETGQGV